MTNLGNVSQIGCGDQRYDPPLDRNLVCERIRHHPGDHRSTYGGRLHEWPDRGVLERLAEQPIPDDADTITYEVEGIMPPDQHKTTDDTAWDIGAPIQAGGRGFGKSHRDELDTLEWPEDAAEKRRNRLVAPAAVILWLVALALLLSVPAVLLAVYRAAL